MKWGTRYAPEYVNRLWHMVERHLRRPHRFVCFTDDASGLETGIEVRPLPQSEAKLGTGLFWRKLGIFANPLADVTGTVLWLDLDVVIVDDLEPLFELPGDFYIIREFSRRAGAQAGNSSVMRFEAGAHRYLLDRFYADPAAANARFAGDQDFICAHVRQRAMWPDGWCVSFKGDCVPPFPLCYVQTPRLPPGAKIVVFHGHVKPPDAARGCRTSGIRRCRPTPWIAEYWR